MTARANNSQSVMQLLMSPKDKVYRWVLLGAVLAATPMGNSALNALGVKTPVMDELVRMKADNTELKTDVGNVKRDVATLAADVANVKKDIAEVKGKADKLDSAFTGFQVDFAKYQQAAIIKEAK